jgi:restriction system protein
MMPIPSFELLFLPILRLGGDGKVRSMAEVRTSLAAEFKLTTAELSEMLPSGRIPRWNSRVGWASFHLMKAGLIEKPKRGYIVITERGLSTLSEHPSKINVAYLERFPEYVEFQNTTPARTEESAPVLQPSELAPPDESIDRAYQLLRAALASDLLATVKAGSPAFFERLVVELLLKMGYGGTHAEAGKAIGQSGDEGVDGIINEDRLGLDVIYIQAKRWEGSVGRPEIQKFVGALHGKRANKGVFITTSVFTPDAQDYVSQIVPRVVLINGRQLAEHMIDFNLGVATRATYDLKRIDSDYFLEE